MSKKSKNEEEYPYRPKTIKDIKGSDTLREAVERVKNIAEITGLSCCEFYQSGIYNDYCQVDITCHDQQARFPSGGEVIKWTIGVKAQDGEAMIIYIDPGTITDPDPQIEIRYSPYISLSTMKKFTLFNELVSQFTIRGSDILHSKPTKI